MRRNLTVAVAIIAVLLLGGCSAKTVSKPSLAPSEVGVVGTAGETSQAATASTAIKAIEPNPAEVEGMPTSLGIQVVSVDGTTTISQVKAMQIVVEKRKPVGAKSAAAKHVLFAKSGDKKPVDAWMITFHGAQLPGADGSASSGKTGSVTVFVDSKTGAILDEVAYEPVAK
jgi:hypothetical protein